MKTKEIRKLISNVFWDLKRDFDSDMDTRDIYYDTGYMVSLCVALGKVKLGQKLHDKFLLH